VGNSPEEAFVPLGNVVARTGLSADTLRYYEREELIPPVARSAGGQRRYTQKDVDRLSFLLRLRATGMPVATMRRFAALRRNGEAGRPGRLALLFAHRAAVRRRVELLQQNL
jgi:DNA-binding transcriptional MerR regulator